jgi:hypothetical protein
MKRIFNLTLGFSTFGVAFFLIGLQTTFVSCTKTVEKSDTVTVTQTDTLIISKDTMVTAQILASRPWLLQYIHGVTANDTVYYTRGGAYNIDFDKQTATFNVAGMGNFIDIVGATHGMTWDFTNSSNTALTLVADNTGIPNQTYSWDNLRYRNDSLLLDQFSSYQGTNSQAEIIWVGTVGN